MRYSLYALAVIILLCSSHLNAQTDVKISKKDFKNDKTGFEAAWQHVIDGDIYFKEGGTWYGNAYGEYLKAIIYNSVNPELNYKTGVAALYSDNKEKAIGFFQKVLEEKSDLTTDLLYFTGHALQYAGKYDEAVEKLNSYLKSAGKKDEELVKYAKKYLEECEAAQTVTRDTLRVEIKNLGSGINSNADEYAELLSTDGKTIFFASRRQLSKSSTEYEDAKFDENIFFSTIVNLGWGMPVSIGKNLTSKYCETPLYLDPAGEELYIYAGYENGGDIRVSMNKRGEWKKPEPVSFNINSSGTETSMTFSPSGQEIWFVSDHGKEGLGGKDLYFIKKLDEKKWSKPVNAGPMINSPYDEESVRFSEKGDTLWFGSKGHTSIGGFDIFYSVKDLTGTWCKAVNFGYPVNTPWDELFFFPKRVADSSFYFASNRPESMGGLDIFKGSFVLPEPVIVPVVVPVPSKPDTVVVRDTVVVIREIVQAPPAPVAEAPKEVVLYLIGKVKDSETGDPVLAKIDVIDLTTDAVVATTASSDVDGSYRVRLPEKKSYMVDVRGTGFLSDMKRINIPGNFTGEVYNLDMSLIKVKVGKKVVLNNILFETGKSVLTANSYTELDRLYNILIDNPQMKIEISGHTDKTGSEPLNFKLSESRAKAVVDYLVKKGIETTRLEYKGFGSLQPIADNATAAGRTKNRRVEFKILEF
jgi:outer membrane protein OmpA-like peptidoglycan-associated protein/tetratricopeptide (TPR) repeat protein